MRELRRGVLAGRSLWITSIPAHLLEEPAYGALLSGAVDGHILQLYGVGVLCTPEQLGWLLQTANQQRLPFQIGLASFERSRKQGDATTNRSCFALIDMFRSAPLFKGVWVFPGGDEWRSLARYVAY